MVTLNVDTLLTKEAVFEKLEPTENLEPIDVLCDINSKVRFSVDTEGNPEVSINDRHFGMEMDAFFDAGRYIGLGSSYIKKSPIDLTLQNLNTWYQRTLKRSMRFVAQNDKIVRLSDKLNEFSSNVVLIDELLKKIGEDKVLGFHRASTSPASTSVSIVCDKRFDINGEDTLYGGIHYGNSIINETPLNLSGYMFRLVCSNGAISQQNVIQRNRNTNMFQQNEWIGNNALPVFNHIDTEFKYLKKLEAINIEGSIGKTLENLFKAYPMSKKIQAQIHEYIAEHNVITMYDLYNAITYVGTHSEDVTDDFRLGDNLQRISGRLSENSRCCHECASILV